MSKLSIRAIVKDELLIFNDSFFKKAYNALNKELKRSESINRNYKKMKKGFKSLKGSFKKLKHDKLVNFTGKELANVYNAFLSLGVGTTAIGMAATGVKSYQDKDKEIKRLKKKVETLRKKLKSSNDKFEKEIKQQKKLRKESYEHIV